MRAEFFGAVDTTRPVVEELIATFRGYRHHAVDIRDRQVVRDLLQREQTDFIVHTAAQPLHDKAAAIPKNLLAKWNFLARKHYFTANARYLVIFVNISSCHLFTAFLPRHWLSRTPSDIVAAARKQFQTPAKYLS